MAGTYTYPGVYIEELSSGVRTITGVSTSVTAFLGRAARGPTDKPRTVTSFAEFESLYGGLADGLPLTFAVRDFFLNGGSIAVIGRLSTASAVKSTVSLPDANTLVLEAKTAGIGGNKLKATITHDAGDPDKFTLNIKDDDNLIDENYTGVIATFSIPPSSVVKVKSKSGNVRPPVTTGAPFTGGVDNAVPASLQIVASGTNKLQLDAANGGAWGNNLSIKIDDETSETSSGLFNLTVFLNRVPFTSVLGSAAMVRIQTEVFRNVSMNPASSRYVKTVVEQSSNLVRAVAVGTVPPVVTAEAALIGGIDSSTLAASDYTDTSVPRRGIYMFDEVDIINLMCVPPDTANGDIPNSVTAAAAAYCETRRAFLVLDGLSSWGPNIDAIKTAMADPAKTLGTSSKNAAVYYPRLKVGNPLKEGAVEPFSTCGAVAGVFARTDATRGVWKAPAGQEAVLVGVPELAVELTDGNIGQLNPIGLNCLRPVTGVGRVVYGARTLQGSDRLASEWKYIPVRRLTLFIEESLYRGTQWAVFEPNDEPLWAQLRLNIGAFMNNLFRQGAFQGSTPKDAYFVKVDRETTTQNDINLGIVNILVGFAPLKPAEFVVIKIQQMVGQLEV